MTGLVVLAVDDEPPALDELAFLLRADPRVAEVRTAVDAVTALQQLEAAPVDAVFLDIRMPGLSGLELARVLARFAAPPAVVFVTAHEGAAVDAFALRAVDYLLKPVRSDRLADALDRISSSPTTSCSFSEVTPGRPGARRRAAARGLVTATRRGGSFTVRSGAHPGPGAPAGP